MNVVIAFVLDLLLLTLLALTQMFERIGQPLLVLREVIKEVVKHDLVIVSHVHEKFLRTQGSIRVLVEATTSEDEDTERF